jgi:hypothetical protein
LAHKDIFKIFCISEHIGHIGFIAKSQIGTYLCGKALSEIYIFLCF